MRETETEHEGSRMSLEQFAAIVHVWCHACFQRVILISSTLIGLHV